MDSDTKLIFAQLEDGESPKDFDMDLVKNYKLQIEAAHLLLSNIERSMERFASDFDVFSKKFTLSTEVVEYSD